MKEELLCQEEMEPVRADRTPEQAEVQAVDRAVDVEDTMVTGPVQARQDSVFVPVAEKKHHIRQVFLAIRLNVQNADNR